MRLLHSFDVYDVCRLQRLKSSSDDRTSGFVLRRGGYQIPEHR